MGITFTSAVSTWIGANGDQVSLHLDTGAGQIVVIEFPVATVTTEWDIAGGTGRFDGASGRVVIVTVFNLVTSTNQSTWEGLISAPGSIKWSN